MPTPSALGAVGSCNIHCPLTVFRWTLTPQARQTGWKLICFASLYSLSCETGFLKFSFLGCLCLVASWPERNSTLLSAINSHQVLVAHTCVGASPLQSNLCSHFTLVLGTVCWECGEWVNQSFALKILRENRSVLLPWNHSNTTTAMTTVSKNTVSDSFQLYLTLWDILSSKIKRLKELGRNKAEFVPCQKGERHTKVKMSLAALPKQNLKEVSDATKRKWEFIT